MKRIKCYIYTRVSTSMQVDGYSLDAQKEKLRKYAAYQDMIVAGEYCDEGKSGKSIEGRPEFLRMLRDVESGVDGVSFVLVFKLSRFGRNAADVLTSLQRMQDFGVNLICVEDGIDSSKDSGKLMISVLSAVAEIERENILVQTMEGRRQKAREGKWNGGFAPYGYKLVDGQLQIAEEEAEVIRIIYDKYIHTTMGTARIAQWLNEHGYSKVCRHNNTREAFTGSFLVGVLDNPVYCGKLAYGRRRNEKVPGTRNQYHIVKQKDYMLYDGIHEPIISEADWQLAQKQRQQTNKRQIKTHSLDHEHVLSGLVKCPVCGGGMYGNVNRKKKSDGTYYKDYFYYACKHRLHVDGKRCDYHRQWGEELIDGAVEEIIHKLVNTPAFEEGIRQKIGGKLDTQELDAEMESLRKQLRQLTGTKDRLGEQIDALDYDDPHYTRKAQDLQERQDKLYDQIAAIEVSIAEVQTRMENIRQHRISTDNVYQFLLYFDKLYGQFTDLEKKTFMNSFIERVEIFPERQSDGRIIKRIEFRFPVYIQGAERTALSWDKTDMSETVDQVFRWILEEVAQAGYLSPKAVFIDGTHIKANANTKKQVKVQVPVASRHYAKELMEEVNADREAHGKEPFDDDDAPPVPRKKRRDNTSRKKLARRKKEKERAVKRSVTDPDSGLFVKGEHKRQFAYEAHTACDKHGFILETVVTPGNVHDSVAFDEVYDRVTAAFPETETIVADSAYKTPHICKKVFEDGRVLSTAYKRPQTKKGGHEWWKYVYDEHYDCVLCPEFQILTYRTTNRDGYREYKSDPKICIHYPTRHLCTCSKDCVKTVQRHIWKDYEELADDARYTPKYQELYKRRKETIERVFADAKEKHAMRYTQYRGLAQVTNWVKLKFAAMNLKKLAIWLWREKLFPFISILLCTLYDRNPAYA